MKRIVRQAAYALLALTAVLWVVPVLLALGIVAVSLRVADYLEEDDVD